MGEKSDYMYCFPPFNLNRETPSVIPWVHHYRKMRWRKNGKEENEGEESEQEEEENEEKK